MKGVNIMSFKQNYIRNIEEVQRAEYVTVPELSLLTHIGINGLYKLVKEADESMIIHVGMKGGRTLVNREAFLAYLKTRD